MSAVLAADWNPLIVAGAALLAAFAGAVPALIVALKTNATANRVEEQTNSRLTDATARIAALEALLRAKGEKVP